MQEEDFGPNFTSLPGRDRPRQKVGPKSLRNAHGMKRLSTIDYNNRGTSERPCTSYISNIISNKTTIHDKQKSNAKRLLLDCRLSDQPSDRPKQTKKCSKQTKTIWTEATTKTKPKTKAKRSSLRRSPMTNSIDKREDHKKGIISIFQRKAIKKGSWIVPPLASRGTIPSSL